MPEYEVAMSKKELLPLPEGGAPPGGSGKDDKAPERLDELARRGRQDIHALKEMAAVFLNREDYENAAAAYQQILDLRPDEPYALNELGVICGKQGDYHKARELLSRVLAEHPNDTYVLSELGLMHCLQGDAEGAASYFEQIVKNSRAGFVDLFKGATSRVRPAEALSNRDKQFIASGRITTANAIATCFAHQVNNPLQIIQNSIYNLLKKVPPGEQAMAEDLKKLRNNANRIHELIQHLYKLIKHDSQDREYLRIREVIFSAYALFEKQLQNRGIRVEVGDIDEAQTDSPVVYGNGVELEQVFINLFANARDALAATGEPRITVTIVRSGEREITIYFSDNGEGISEENLEQIFDSLFTTKPQGTGLGLWLCLSVINQMDGKIRVDSRLGEGTTFTIRLPTR